MLKLNFSTQLTLLKFFLIEEYRRHIRYVSPVSFYLFPVYIALFTYLAVAFGLDNIVFEYGAFFYGIGVGAFGYLGIQYLRKRLKEFLLVNLPEVLPLTYKTVFLYLFMRDLIYYLVLVGLSVILVLIILARFALILNIVVMFLLGYSASYGISMAYLKNRIRAGLLILPLIPVMIPIYGELPLIKIVLIPTYILIGFALTPSEIQLYIQSTKKRVKCTKFGSRPLIVKTWIDMLRSGMPMKLVFGYFLPLLLILMFSDYLSGRFENIKMNSIGYSSMLGFLTLVIYSWLTTVDDHTYLSLLPARPYELIKSIFIVYFILSSIIVVPTTLVITILRKEYIYLPIALAVGLSTSVYGFWCLARLTGLNTTSMLFDPIVMLKFSLAVIPPNMLVLAHSMVLHAPFSLPVIIICIILIILITYSNIKKVRKYEDFEN